MNLSRIALVGLILISCSSCDNNTKETDSDITHIEDMISELYAKIGDIEERLDNIEGSLDEAGLY